PVWIFSTAAGDATNGQNQAVAQFYVAHPSITADAPRRADGSPDLRYQAKIRTLTTPLSAPGGTGIPTPIGFANYPTQTSSTPIMRNEELILLRAEANIGLGNISTALADIDLIRTVSGGLAPTTLTATSPKADLITELLLQRRMSLLTEGHRWVD